MKEKGSRNRVVGGGPRERRIRDPIERLLRSVFLRRTDAWTRRKRKSVCVCVVARSNGVDLIERIFSFSSRKFGEIGWCCACEDEEMPVSIVSSKSNGGGVV